MIVSLWNILEQPASTGGTWTLVSGPIGAPAPPGTYDGTVDFTSVPNGTYIYEYTVVTSCLTQSDSSKVTINKTSAPAPVNNDCVGSLQLPYSSITETGGLAGLNSKGDCTNLANPSLSSVTLPNNWPVSIDNDLWYVINFPATGEKYNAEISISSAAYGSEAHLNPIIALYTGQCSALTFLNSSLGTSTQVFSTVQVPAVSNNGYKVYIRVASSSSTFGLFDINVRAIANVITTPEDPSECCGELIDYFIDFKPYSYVLNTIRCEEEPIVTRTGDDDNIFTITYAEGCAPKTTTIRGRGAETDSNGDIFITFQGDGLRGNTTNDNFIMPSIELLTSAELSLPGSPITVHRDTYPITEVLQIGDTPNPSLQLRIQGLNAFEVFYLIFKW